MTLIEELRILATVALAHGDKVMKVNTEMIYILTENYLLLEERLGKIENAVAELTDSRNYAKGM